MLERIMHYAQEYKDGKIDFLTLEIEVDALLSASNEAKPIVSRPFAFGEWVLIDGVKSGQIVDFYGNGWYMVDFAGVWERYKVDRITKDNRYLANGC